MKKINTEIANLLHKMDCKEFAGTGTISVACPIPYFGNIHTAKIATVGINPSNLEFLDTKGAELQRGSRRFPTLTSFNLLSWIQARATHIDLIEDSCTNYFKRNPYDTWFKKLDHIISGSNYSYYFPLENACHLDLIPYATQAKWSELSNNQRNKLIRISENAIGALIDYSSITHLVLNGKSVINIFKQMFGVNFVELPMETWDLPRKTTAHVKGTSYIGVLRTAYGSAGRDIVVLGYNHNIQSSFGVTSQVQRAIRNWVSDNVMTQAEAV